MTKLHSGRSLPVGAIADAIGQCVLVFAFLPPLASLPSWLLFELRNPLNATDPVVLTFLPVRGAILLLHAFRAGVVNGVLAGLVAGTLACVWVARGGDGLPVMRQRALGALGGALAALAVVLGTLARAAVQGGDLSATPLSTVAFEIGAGLVCGLIAAPRALRLAAAVDAPPDGRAMTLPQAHAWLEAVSRGVPAALVVTAIYGAIVVWGALHHEPWRDEVVPLSIVRHARSLGDLVASLRFEGHPLLWYVVLWCGDAVLRHTWVLKAASVGSAVAAVFLLNRSPLPWWLRWLVTFSFFPLFQYSVVSRGYSVEMLCVFAFCTLHPHRQRHPVAMALVLAALANTEAFGFIMAVAAAVMLAVEWMLDERRWRVTAIGGARLVSVAVLIAGLALAVLTAFPASTHPLAAFSRSRGGIDPTVVAQAFLRPGAHMEQIAMLPYPSLWLWAYFAYLAPRVALLALAIVGFVGIETFFLVIYGPGAFWHLGNVVLVLVAVMWIDADGTLATRPLPASLARVRGWLGGVLAVGVVLFFAGQVRMAYDELARDARFDYSANRSFAELLRSDPTLAGAVVMGEPDMPLWSLPYYADNRIYLPREQVFRPWGIFRPERARTYDLGSLLATARRVRGECECPVVVTLGSKLETLGVLTNQPGTYAEERFLVTAAARDEFVAATRHVAYLGPTITDERYDVYVLR